MKLQNKVCVLLLDDVVNRATRNNFFDKLAYTGLRGILAESDIKFDVVGPLQIKDYDFCLISLTSVMDIQNLIETFEKGVDKGNCKIIVGGAGCVNIWTIIDYIDVAVFGRADNQLLDILGGKESDNIWRKSKDPELEGKYNVRQPIKLYSLENTVGCKNKCFYCQYTWTRKHFGAFNYNPGDDANFQEDDIFSLKFNKAGRYLTAIDGFSESSRFMVNKRISDKILSDKLAETYLCNRDAAINLKIYSMVGYPWETVDTVKDDITKMNDIFKSIDRGVGEKGSRVLSMIYVTPFSPEPLTPMQYCKANVDINWKSEIEKMGRQVYKGIDFETFILPQINVPYTLAKRVMINRADRKNYKAIKKILLNRRVNSLHSSQQMNALRNSGIIDMAIFNELEKEPVPYLDTYSKFRKLNRFAQNKELTRIKLWHL